MPSITHVPPPSYGRQARALCTLAFFALASCHLAREGTAIGPVAVADDSEDDDEVELTVDAGQGSRDASTKPRQDAGKTTTPNVPEGPGNVPELPGPNDASAGDARVDGGSVPESDACTLAGTYALHAEIDLTWDGWIFAGIIPVLSPGSGTMTMTALSQVKDEMSEVTVRPCAATLPDFETDRTLADEVYGVDLPDELWEQPSIPTWRTQWQVTCDMPGCAFSSGELEAVVGGRVTSVPFRWPEPGVPSSDFTPVDDDADGEPGITMIPRGPSQVDAQGRPYSYPPLFPSFARARKMMVALGLRAKLEGKLEGCDRLAGSLLPNGVYARGLACTGTYDDGSPFRCDQDHVTFLDSNMPKWIARSARFRAIRLSEATCTAARAAVARTPSSASGDAGMR